MKETNMATKTTSTRRKVTSVPKNKADGFAVGVSQAHYWIITTLAQAKNTNRVAILEKIIDGYIQHELVKQ